MATVNSAIFIGGPLYNGGSSVIQDLAGSGFTQVFGWSGIDASGDIVYAGQTLVSQGQYVDTSGFAQEMVNLKTPPSSVVNLQFMLGGWDSQNFPSIKALIFPTKADYPDNPQIGPTTVLYQNFDALKKALPIDGINFDDETLYDQPTTVAFGQLLNSLGYQVTYNPYRNTSFWVNCLEASEEIATGLVSGFYLQCYAGGSSNTPGPWIKAVQNKMGPDYDAAALIKPGLWCANGPNCDQGQCPSSIESTFANWKSTGITTGWIWLWDDINSCESSGGCNGEPMDTAAYATAVANGLS